MKGRVALVIGAAAGYVFGAKAGTERYEQIKAQADRVRRDPRVQEKAAQAQDLAKDTAEKAQSKAQSKTRSKVPSNGGTTSAPAPTPTAAASTGSAKGTTGV